MKTQNHCDALSRALKALVQWCRDHTGPHDPNTPYELMIDGIVAYQAYDDSLLQGETS
jgi:hypothetical protein